MSSSDSESDSSGTESVNARRSSVQISDGSDTTIDGSDVSIESNEEPSSEKPNQDHFSDDTFVNVTLQWAISVPIGLGLCPWAIKSHNQGLLRIVSCDCEDPSDVARVIESEIFSLTRDDKEVAPVSTTLLVCAHVEEWNDFRIFEEFVIRGIKQHLLNDEAEDDILDNVTLVAFHPAFLKWRALHAEIGVGSIIHSHWGMVGQKSVRNAEATIVEMENRAFGLRKVKVRFTEVIEGRQDQYVPVDWIIALDGTSASQGDPLPDNVMYQSPYPTVHIINNEDLVKLCVGDVSRVKRLNAQRMARLGWDGLTKLLGKNDR